MDNLVKVTRYLRCSDGFLRKLPEQRGYAELRIIGYGFRIYGEPGLPHASQYVVIVQILADDQLF